MKSNTLFKWFFSSTFPDSKLTTTNTMSTTSDDKNLGLGLGLGLGLALQPPSDSNLDHHPSDNDLDEYYFQQSLTQELQNLVLTEQSRIKLVQEGGWNGEDGEENNNSNNSYTEGEEEVDEIDEEGEGKFGKEDEILEKKNRVGERRVLYPVRPEAEDCAYYMKTGSCRFGSNCKFNHPLRRKTQGLKSTRDKTKEKEEPRERPGQTECKYYLKTGGCRFGKACRFNHARAKAPIGHVLELNFLGLPIRLGEKECPYYMRTGSCKYGATCKFNHPDPTAGGGDASDYSNGGSSSLQSPSHFPVAPWSAPGPLNEAAPAPFVPMLYPPTQGVSSPHAEWNGYQFPMTPPGPTLHPPPAYVMKPPPAETHKYSHNQQLVVADEFPERPGQPECSYYLKTGDCKFKSNCKYHHPRDRMKRSVSVVLSDKGLPLRPDQNVCSYYNRYGICKFGPSCKFDHPVDLSPTPGSASNQQPSVFNSANADGPTVASTLNVSDAVIQQSV